MLIFGVLKYGSNEYYSDLFTKFSLLLPISVCSYVPPFHPLVDAAFRAAAHTHLVFCLVQPSATQFMDAYRFMAVVWCLTLLDLALQKPCGRINKNRGDS